MAETTEIRAEELKNLLQTETEFEDPPTTENLKGLFAEKKTFRNCTFMDCAITGCFFEGARFEGCNFYGCEVKLVEFKNAVFTGCTSTSRFVMCNFSHTTFNGTTFRRGYIANSQIDLTQFTDVTFDGIWAKNLSILGPALFENVLYTMGGARCDEVEVQKELFFKEFGNPCLS